MDCPGFRFEVVLQVSAARMFKAMVLEGHILIPKIMPHIVSSASFVKGDGGPGSIRRFNFTDVLPFTHVDEHIEVLDEEKLEFRFSMKETVRDGRVISASYLMQFQPCEKNGSTTAAPSICRTVAEYNTAAGGAEAKEEEIISGKEGVLGMVKNIEAYLIANPTAFA